MKGKVWPGGWKHVEGRSLKADISKDSGQLEGWSKVIKGGRRSRARNRRGLKGASLGNTLKFQDILSKISSTEKEAGEVCALMAEH